MVWVESNRYDVSTESKGDSGMMPGRMDITELAYRVTGRFPSFAPPPHVIAMFLRNEAPELIANLDAKTLIETIHVVSGAWEFLKKLFQGAEGEGRSRRCKFVHKSFGTPCGAAVHVFRDAGYIVAICEAGHEQRRKTSRVSQGLLEP
jgi:hypothetical protein